MKGSTRTKRWLATICGVALLAVAQSAPADDMLDKLKNTTPQERATIQTLFMKKKLGLEGPEAAKVEAINLKYAEKAEPVIKGDEGMFARMRQMKEIQTGKDQELQGVLTPAQYQAYEASKDEMKQQMEQSMAKKAMGGS